eukprot:COSAG01_NODE_5515_length_4208_cov_9.547578_2_plen_41_part_00
MTESIYAILSNVDSKQYENSDGKDRIIIYQQHTRECGALL